jgi:hypothetical protein
MDFIGLTKEAEDYLHGAGEVMSYTYAVEFPNGYVAHLRSFRHHTQRIPVTCSVAPHIMEVVQECVGGRIFTCLVLANGWYYSAPNFLPGLPFAGTDVDTVWDNTLRSYKLAKPVKLDNAMFQWKREVSGAERPMYDLDSTHGIIPNSWFPPETTPEG